MEDIEKVFGTLILVIITAVVGSQLYLAILELAQRFIRDSTDSDAFAFVVMLAMTVTFAIMMIALLSYLQKDQRG